MRPSVRNAQTEDVPAIVGLYLEVAEEVVAREPTLRHIPDSDALERRYRSRIDEANRVVLVAVVDGAVIGFVDVALQQHEDEGMYSRTGVYVHVEELVVAESHRRRGAGRALLQAVDARAKDAGARMIWVDTHVTNDAARALYTAAGYLEFGVVLKREL